MKRIYSFLTSLTFMSVIFIALAFSMAVATFIESSQGTPTARALVYNSFWFELLWALFALNLVNNIFKYRFFKRKKFAIGFFHVSFVIILLGAVITRYISFEGTMHIRENKNSNYILTTDDYFFAGIGDVVQEKKIRLSERTPKKYSEQLNIAGNTVKIKTSGYIANAEPVPVPSETGEPVIDFVYTTMGGQGMQSYIFKKGELFEFPGFSAGFENHSAKTVEFFMNNGSLVMTSPLQIAETSMMSQESTSFNAGDTIPVKIKVLYAIENFRFLVRNFLPSATYIAQKSESQTGTDAVLVEITEGGLKQTVSLFGKSGIEADTLEVPLKSGNLRLAFGAKPHPLSFSIFLRDFQLERYPGSSSPSSYASEVTLIDPGSGIKKDLRIYMNNTLTHKGYKFFQSSYDTDEMGTILSVNHDFWGSIITYIGYALMILGMIIALISKNTHFANLIRRLKESSVKTVILFALITGSVSAGYAQPGNGASIPGIDKNLVKRFSELWVQGVDGRIEPLSTLNNELVRKISRKSSLYGKSADEVALSMMAYPERWRTLPIIRVSNKTLAEQLGADGKFITMNQLFDNQGNYKIAEQVQAAYNKAPAFRNRVEKEYLYVDERVNICYMIMEGSIFHLFPRMTKEETWHIPGAKTTEYRGGDSLFISSGIQYLLQSVVESKTDNANQVLQAVENFQKQKGGSLIPSETKKNIEITYNKVNPFKRVFPFYLLFGFILLVILFVNIFRRQQLPNYLKQTFFGLIFLGFLLHTLGLIFRWYISGHAPWSNGFESIVYVAWAAMLAGLIFGRKYPIVVGTSALLAGISLFVAHLSWMNPEITPLVPVLKSYWLTIHVAIITASYGFIGLSAFLGILVLGLIIFRNNENGVKVNGYIEQLTTINEMSATVGLYFLTIGTFLGGIWANESWGRYWGWDPKETWSLITISIYSLVVHMRLIPPLKGTFNYNVAIVLAFFSVLMTYFGVNYYLSGLHSYGKGSADGVGTAIYITLIVLIALMLVAYFKEMKFEKEKQRKK